jgi:hypothetical protein
MSRKIFIVALTMVAAMFLLPADASARRGGHGFHGGGFHGGGVRAGGFHGGRVHAFRGGGVRVAHVHRHRHHHHGRHFHPRIRFAAAPLAYGYYNCWRWAQTPYGYWTKVNVCY